MPLAQGDVRAELPSEAGAEPSSPLETGDG